MFPECDKNVPSGLRQVMMFPRARQERPIGAFTRLPRELLVQSVNLNIRAVPQSPLRVLLLQSVHLKSQLHTWLGQSVKLKGLLHALLLRSGNLKGHLDMSPVQSKSHLCVLLRQSLSLKGRLRVLPRWSVNLTGRLLVEFCCRIIEVNITIWGDSLSTPQHELDHVISAKSLFDPASMTVGKYHTGFHDDIVTGIFNRPSFEYVLTDFLQFLIAIRSEQPRRRKIYLGIVCKKGRHRSVALAVLFQHVVLLLGAARCNRTFVSDEIGEWRHLCRGCSHCNEYSIAKIELQSCRITSVWQYLHRRLTSTKTNAIKGRSVGWGGGRVFRVNCFRLDSAERIFRVKFFKHGFQESLELGDSSVRLQHCLLWCCRSSESFG